LNPITPKATAKLWAAIGGSLGAIDSQHIADAANWGQFEAGAAIGELEALFPRIETTEEAK
jgi:methionyl-tRNA synthetase